MRLDQILSNAAREAPDTPALIFEERALSFEGLDARVDRLANALLDILNPGDRVAVLAQNHPAVVEAYYAVPRAGMGLVLLNYRLEPEDIATQLRTAGATVLIGERALLDRVAAQLDDLPALRVRVSIDEAAPGERDYEALLADAPAEPAADRGGDGDDALAWIIFTSGTTGRAKGVMLSHRNLATGALVSVLDRPVGPDDVYLYPFPLCHVSGHNVLAIHLRRRPVVLMRRFDAARLLEEVARHRVTMMSLAPTMIAMLLDSPGLDTADTSSLRAVGYGASAIPSEVLRRAIDALGCEFSQGYGMTELGGNACFLSAAHHARGVAGEPDLLRAAGRPSPLIEMRILDDEGRDVARGESGEIAFRGDQVTRGYFENPEATERAYRDGWFLTGDIARRDEEGLLYIVDRKKDIIITGGENVSSREVEDALHDHPDVQEAAAIGAPDPKWGERVAAVVVRRPGTAIDEADLVAFARERLAGIKAPRTVLFLDELPKNLSGKVLKNELRAWLAEADAAD